MKVVIDITESEGRLATKVSRMSSTDTKPIELSVADYLEAGIKNILDQMFDGAEGKQ